MLNREQRREARRKGEAMAFALLSSELAKSGPEAVESCVDGMLDTCGRMLRENVSPDYAFSVFHEVSERLGRFARGESGA